MILAPLEVDTTHKRTISKADKLLNSLADV